MNKVLRKSAIKVLLIPKVRKMFEKIYPFYAVSRIEQELDTFKGEPEFHAILRTEKLAPRRGAFHESDAKALAKVVKMAIKKKVMIAEVGSWKGMSTAVLAKAAADNHGSVFAIDHWMGSEGVPDQECAKTEDVYSIFKRNMILLGVWDVVHPLVMDSETASQIFTDGVMDLVFIDADHRYESVKKDISSWLPKLRDGGILCGHDCEGYYSEYSEEDRKMIEEHLEDDCIFTAGDHSPPGSDYARNICHPGVVKALHELFQGKYSLIPDSTIWYYIEKGSSPNS